MSRLIDQPERRGWALRRTGEGDGRRLVELSTEGTKVAADVSNLLMKLGMRRRTEAAVYATRLADRRRQQR